MSNEKKVTIELFEWEALVLLAALRDTARLRWEEREGTPTTDESLRDRLGDMANDCKGVMNRVLTQAHDAPDWVSRWLPRNCQDERCKACHGTTDPLLDAENKGVLV